MYYGIFDMKELRWSPEKDSELKAARNVTFADLVNSRFIGVEKHMKRTHQQLMLFEFNKYVWVVPFIEEEGYLFLKTAYPSRKSTKKYLKGE